MNPLTDISHRNFLSTRCETQQLDQWYGMSQLTTAQRLALTPKPGFVVYDKNVDVYYGWDGTTWQILGGTLSIPGPRGPNGSTGPTGLDGSHQPGFLGPPGPTGQTGPTGINGNLTNTGFQGPQGIPGLTGPLGPTGISGSQNQKYAGPTGITDSVTGATGPNGVAGSPGSLSGTGPAGPSELGGLWSTSPAPAFGQFLLSGNRIYGFGQEQQIGTWNVDQKQTTQSPYITIPTNNPNVIQFTQEGLYRFQITIHWTLQSISLNGGNNLFFVLRDQNNNYLGSSDWFVTAPNPSAVASYLGGTYNFSCLWQNPSNSTIYVQLLIGYNGNPLITILGTGSVGSTTSSIFVQRLSDFF